MTTDEGPIIYDVSFLHEASKRLHGYTLHLWFRHYLALIMENMHRWVGNGVVGADAQPTRESDYALLFDLDAIDLEKLSYLVGFYMYVLSSHKKTNYILMQKTDTKRVLYLRGFDYESAVAGEDGAAVGFSSIDTTRFTNHLGDALHGYCEVFTPLSPKDLYWGTASAQRYFYGDFDGLIRSCSTPIRLIYFNANYWHEDVTALFDRMDYFVVYVSSITESVLWEIEQLKARGRAGQTTIVFDDDAIENKRLQEGVQEKMRETQGDRVVWSKSISRAARLSADELRQHLEQDFLVVSTDDFLEAIDLHKARIGDASGPVGVGEREVPMEFRFSPAVDDEVLRRIESFEASVSSLIRQGVEEKTITNLPYFLNTVQLEIFASLLLGRHDAAGRALAVYAGVMDATRRHLLADGTGGGLTADQSERAAGKLQEHLEYANYASPRLLAYGKSDEFGDYSAAAKETHAELTAAASQAVEDFFTQAARQRDSAGPHHPQEEITS